MFAFILILMMIIIGSATFSKPNKFNTGYISKDGTAPIKGIFVILIVLSHSKGYFESDLAGFWDKSYTAVQGHLGQMVVAMFLFYSGYGIMEQIKKREFDYIKGIPSKRFPNLLLNFDIAVMIYFILSLCIGKQYSVKQVLLSFIGWTSVGNSSWYIFVTLCLYILTFLSFFIIKWMKNKKLYIINIIILTVLNAAFVYVLMKIGKDSWWFDTAIIFSLGFWYSYFKDAIEKIVMKNDITYFTTLAFAVLAYVITYFYRKNGIIYYSLFGFAFVLTIVIITMKVEIKSNLLNWFGDHIFSVYILQRIPMIIMDKAGLSHSHRYIFVILSFAITCAIAEIYDTLYAKLSAKIWKPKK